jgi:tetratricopeptide (TPR) repeat protein
MDSRIQSLLNDPELVRTCTWFSDSGIWDKFLNKCLEIISTGSEAGKRHAKTVVQHAPKRCQRVQGWGLLAQIHRTLGDLDKAEAAIEQAFFIAEGCSECPPDLHRRRAYIKRNRHDWAGALADADTAIDQYRELGHAGHDLRGNGLASSLNVRGLIRFYKGDPATAAADLREALVILHPAVSPTLYRIVLTNLALFLSATGSREDLLLADQHIRKARRLFKGVSLRSQERAKLDWITAMIRHQLEYRDASRLRDMMQDALDTFLDLGMQLEAIAVASDMARMIWHHGDSRPKTQAIVENLLGRLRLADLAPEVAGALRKLEEELDAMGWDGHQDVRAAIEALREACGAADNKGDRVLTCLVTWRELGRAA